ncbi:MAG: DUF134 domain-containing protein [Clostridiales bacterium]|nr:DUF134 domain-containing protein [Clostridiales bacterium]
MARPTKWRKIEYVPTSKYFVPNDYTQYLENLLKLEEIEAIRLKDLEGLDQVFCAEKMEVSRATFQRILISARSKIADSIINGKAIRIGGGKFTRNVCTAICRDCGHTFEDSFENFAQMKQGSYKCPKCGSINVYCNGRGLGKCRQGNCNRRGQG